jgi:hypothetical protein
MAGAIHPGKRKANPMLTKNGKPRIKGWSLSQLTDAMEKAQRNKDQAKFRKEIQRRFG